MGGGGMALVLRFYTKRFDVSQERPNPITRFQVNHFFCGSRIRPKGQWSFPCLILRTGVGTATFNGTGDGTLVGASASDEEGNGEREWVLQIDKQRSVKEKLLG